ncbi:MAG: rhomboid family intramembrane serine protease [Planctomycetes bacterium]|nr:rhomboid family intramembrane serine protease [Planctomycetota bacterium]
MGIYDRDYFRPIRGIRARRFLASPLRVIIAINVVVFLLQMLIGDPLTSALACRANDLFGGFPLLWKPVTAAFAHGSPMHLLFNMFFLFVFGREIEALYDRRDFLVIYLGAGIISVVSEAVIQQIGGNPQVLILGASGAVMALVVLTAMFYPQRRVMLIFLPFVTFPLWLLCVFFVLMDLMGALSPAGPSASGVANFAHLAGAAYGFSYRYFDLRWANLRRWLRPLFSSRRARPRRPRDWKVFEGEKRDARRAMDPDQISISLRIDDLLTKISRAGIESLSEEEKRFLAENSGRYRSPS